MTGYRVPARYRYRPRYRGSRRGSGAERAVGFALGLVLVVSGLGAKTAVTVTHHANTAATAGGTLDCRQLEQLWDAAGGNPSAAFMAAEVATAESSGRQYAYLADSNGTADEGYWQINTSHGSLATYDPYRNARAAVIISGNGTNWTPWVTYNRGKYIGKC